MQTFLPYTSYRKSAQCLDYRRLGKQRVECKQIYKALTEEKYGWKNHPATKMWRGHEGQLIRYAEFICWEWRARGYKDQQLEYFEEVAKLHPLGEKPEWLNEEICHTHRSNILKKDPEFYAQYSWKEPDDIPYYWPVK